MPRIIDVDTEAFAPTHVKEYVPPREHPKDTSLRRMGTKMQLAGQALPLVGAGASLLDQYLITPIQQKLKAGREEEYKGAKAGEELLEGGETPMQKIARERLEKNAVALEAQKPEYFTGGSEAEKANLASMFGQERPLFDEYRTSKQEADAAEWAVKEREARRADEEPAAREQYFRDMESIMSGQDEEPTETKYQGAAGRMMRTSKLPDQDKQAPTPAASIAAERLKPTAQPFSPEELKRYGFDERGAYLPHPVPEGKLPEVTSAKSLTTPRPGAESGFAGTTAEAGTTATAETAKAAAAPAAPAAPKTLATATDDELADAGRKLKRLVEQNPGDTEYARRLRQVELEQRHREEKIEFEDWAPIARGADTPEEQQRALELAKRVRMPWRGSFQDILKTPFERAREEAIGTREEKGLFPEMGRPLSQYDIALKKAQTAYAEAKANGETEKQARNKADAVLKMATAGLRTAQEEEVRTMTPIKAGEGLERMRQIHANEEKLIAQTKAINEKLPEEIKLMQSRSRNFEAAARRVRSGGVGRGAKDELLKAYTTLVSQDEKNIDDIEGLYKDALRNEGSIKVQAENDMRDAATSAEQVENLKKYLKTTDLMIDDEKRSEIQLKINNAITEARNKQAKAEASKKQADQAQANIDALTTQRTQAMEQARQNKVRAESLIQQWADKRGVKLEPVTERPLVPPTTNKPAAPEKSFLERANEFLRGGGVTPTTKPAAPSSNIKTTTSLPPGVTLTGEIKVVNGIEYAIGSNGKGYKIKR